MEHFTLFLKDHFLRNGAEKYERDGEADEGSLN
jgi:hypothetical protein